MSTALKPPPAAPWWLNPGIVVLLIVPATLFTALLLTDAEYRTEFNTPKYLTESTAVICMLAALVLATAATLMITPARTSDASMIEDPRVGRSLWRSSQVLFTLTLIGYGAFAISGALNGVTLASVVSALTSQNNYTGDFKTQFATIPGVTTLTQAGMAFVIVALYTRRHRRSRRLVAQIVIVFVLAVVRAFLYSERLALIELAVPALAVAAAGAVTARRLAPRAMVHLAPVLAVPVVFGVFAVFEYSRSWQYFSTRTDKSFLEFAALRFGGYYATAYNNGQMQLDHLPFPGRLPDASLAAFWTAPGISNLGLYEKWSATPPESSLNILERFGNPEFNNPGGLTTPFVDFGMVGGFLFFLVAGVVLGVLYRGMRDGRITGSLLYPLMLTGLTDLPRYVYWTQGRVVPSLVGLLLVAVFAHRARRPGWQISVPARPPRASEFAARELQLQ